MRKKITLFIFLLLASIFTQAQPGEEIQKLLALDGTYGDEFGRAVDISGDYAIIGANGDDGPGPNSGAAYIFYHNQGVWTEQAKLKATDGGDYHNFGRAVGISGDYAIMGARGHDEMGSAAGAAYVFHNSGGTWTQQAKLIASDAYTYDYFGQSVVISGNYAFIGAHLKDEAGVRTGAVYVYYNNAGTWTEQAKLLASDGVNQDNFGFDIAYQDDYLLVGAHQNDDFGSMSGSVYVFHRSGSVWDEVQRIVPSDSDSHDDFGCALDIDNGYAIIGAYGDEENGGFSGAGSAYIYRLIGGTWQFQDKIFASVGGTYNYFGISVSISGTCALVGTYEDTGAGSVYVFNREESNWSLLNRLTASETGDWYYFGESVCLVGDYAMIGSVGYNNDIGAAFYFGPKLPKVWSGDVDNNWHDPGNWADAEIPDADDDVLVPTGLTNYPTLSAVGECYNITLESNINGTATLLDNGYLTINGVVNIERYFTGNDLDWHLVSSPISNAKANVFEGMYLQSFDEPTYTYFDITNGSFPLKVMEGYGLYSKIGATNTITFTGNMNTGLQSGSFVSGADANNWNLMGNPYPSSIDWEIANIPGNMSNEVHYIEALTGNDLSYVKGTGGIGSRYIAPHQGFFISSTGTGTLTFDDSDRTHSGTSNFYKTDNPNLLILQATSENFVDETWIHFNENAGVEHDGVYDAYKRISLSNPELPQIFSITPSNVYLSVNGLHKTETVHVGFTAVNSGIFTIEATEVMESTDVILEDLKTNEITDLLLDYHIFNFTKGDDPERFVVHFVPQPGNENTGEQFYIYSFKKDVYVTAPSNTEGEIYIYSITGKQVANEVLNSSLNKLSLENAGCYIVKVRSGQKITTGKVIIQ